MSIFSKLFVIFAGKVQDNILLGMKNQEVKKLQRMALGITQQDLADMSEIAISTIKKIERRFISEYADKIYNDFMESF